MALSATAAMPNGCCEKKTKLRVDFTCGCSHTAAGKKPVHELIVGTVGGFSRWH